jgi:hypothetical protein
MAASGKVGSNTGEFVACAGLKFPPPSTSMVAQRFPKVKKDRTAQDGYLHLT